MAMTRAGNSLVAPPGTLAVESGAPARSGKGRRARGPKASLARSTAWRATREDRMRRGALTGMAAAAVFAATTALAGPAPAPRPTQGAEVDPQLYARPAELAA